jgi:membrane-bound lytic murein transglycosylase A
METAALPDLSEALAGDRSSLLESLDWSLEWYSKPSSREYFPLGGISHERAWASVYAFRELLARLENSDELEQQLQQQFDFYSSQGSDGRGTVLFTGYYSPVFDASRTSSEVYRYPLYRRPSDLVVDEATGATLGQRVAGEVVPYPTRAAIEGSRMLAGDELVWLSDLFEAYLVQVQGSAALRLPDGSTMQIGYAGNNGYEYVSVARILVDEGKIREDELSLDEVRGYFETHPHDLEPYLRRNPRFVFFREEYSENWPAGSLGVKVTPLRTIATDKGIFPPGAVTLVVTGATDPSGRLVPFEQFMLDQDAGGAIRSPGRADLYFGVGREAERRAGDQYAEGRLYYMFLNDERFGAWRDKIPVGGRQ